MTELLRSLLTLPARFVRGLWRFVEPQLKVGRIPFGRTALVLQLIAALTFIGYTLIKKDVRFPFTPQPYLVDVILPDAKGLNPKKEPGAGVAGVAAGKVIAATVENGQARVTLRLDSDLKGKIFKDATAFVRPSSVLQTLLVNIQPGDPEAGPLPDDTAIPASRTGTFVGIDELTGVLDANTQAQVQVLIHEAATALNGREPQLRRILDKLGRLTDGATPLARALADRRVLLSRLTEHLDRLFTTLGQRGVQLAHAVDAGSRTLEVTANREPELSDATRQLAPTLLAAQRSLAATRGLAQPLVPALDTLTPVAGELKPASEKLSELAPKLDDFVGTGAALVRDGKRPVRLLAGGLKGQAEKVRNDQIPALEELVHLAELLYEYRNGIVQFAAGWSGATSTNRRAGPYAQFGIVNAEIPPGGLGLKAAAAKTSTKDGSQPSRLSRLLAEMLEHTCRDSNPAACLLRFETPGLPSKPLLDPAGKPLRGGN